MTILQDKGYIVGSIAACSRCVVACYNVAWRNKSSAGSGNLVPPFAPQRRREGNISNPRVLSDMGLAIPRPTRLGDPRSVASCSTITPIKPLLLPYNNNRRGGVAAAAAAASPIQGFEDYLKAQNKRNIRQILCYARQYAPMLHTGDATSLVNLQSSTKRRHSLEALTELSKYQGCYDNWCTIRKKYQLKWTNGDESIQAMTRFFNPESSLDSMLSKVRKMIAVLPSRMGEVVKFCAITGLRSSESVESMRLLACAELAGTRYYNPERQVLEHFRFADVFLRATKKAYLSYLSLDNYHHFANLGPF